MKTNEIKTKLLMDELSTAYSDPDVKKKPELQKMILNSAKKLNNGDDYKLVSTRLCKAIALSYIENQKDYPGAIIKLHNQIKNDATKYDGVAIAAMMLPIWF